MKKPSLIKRFFSFLLRLCVVLVLMAAIAVGSFEGVTYYLTGSFTSVKKAVKEETDQSGTEDSTEATTVDNKNMENTLVFVHDDMNNKDYTALNMYNTKTEAMDVLLLPCNAQVSVSSTLLKEIRNTMTEAGSSVNMADVARAFGDKKYEMFAKIVEDISGAKISGYDVISSTNFKKLLNVAGGVSYHFNNAISYRDTENILQTIDAGDVILDGTTAYALFTYMDGTDGEESSRLERVNTYLTSYMEALLSKNSTSAIAKKYDSLVTAEGKSGLTSTEDILKNLTTDALTIRIMQGSESKGIFTLDSQKVKLQVAGLAKQAEAYSQSSSSKSSTGTTSTSAATGSTESSKNYSIEIYNAAYVSGLAGQWESYLESEGYSISLVDSYQEEGPLSQTRINVTQDGMGQDLLTYFPDAEINVEDSISTGGDIQIYIGTDSTNVPAGSDSTTDTEDETVTDSSLDDESDSTDSTNSTDVGDADDTTTSGGYDFGSDSEQ